jgi:TolA-binding protein
MAGLRQQIAQQDERIDGLTTIIEGLSASLNELQMKRTEPPVIVESGQSNDALLQKLAAMIDDINENYVSKEEMQKALGKKNMSKKSVSKKSTGKTSVKKEKDSFQGKSNAKLYSEGVRLFVKKRYSEAHKRFSITDTKGYKPAASNYYLGEIAYYTKKYEDAIFYFKKSAGIYDQASYIDTLLLHTAVSLEKKR